MVNANTIADIAMVQDTQASRDFVAGENPCKSVGSHHLQRFVWDEQPISSLVVATWFKNTSLPQPTIAQVWHVIWNRSVFIYLRPKALLDRYFETWHTAVCPTCLNIQS